VKKRLLDTYNIRKRARKELVRERGASVHQFFPGLILCGKEKEGEGYEETLPENNGGKEKDERGVDPNLRISCLKGKQPDCAFYSS